MIACVTTKWVSIIRTFRVAEQWKLGRKGVDDGVLMLVAKDDHKVRIEVGYGLEGVINDAAAKRVVAEDILPAFRKGDFHAGLAVGIERISALIDGEALPAPQDKNKGSDDSYSVLKFGFFLVLFLGGLFRDLYGRIVGSTLVGVVAGLLAGVWSGLQTGMLEGLLPGMWDGLLTGMLAGVVAFVFILLWGFVSDLWGFVRSFGGGSSGSGGGGGGFGGGGASGQW